MKIKILLLTTLLLNLKVLGQITTTKIASTPNTEVVPTTYDSTQNYLGKYPQLYIGQELYLKGLSETLRKYGYEKFYNDIANTSFTDKSAIYKCCDGYNSKYADLAGKYFKVIDVIKHPKAQEKESLYGRKYFLKLQDKSNNEILYYEYDNGSSYSFPFIVVGFFEKTKKEVIGREFIFADQVLQSSHDIATGKALTKVTGQKWECVDLTIEERYYTLSLVIQNSLNEKADISYESVFGSGAIKRCTYSVNEVENYKKKYGEDNFNTILQGKVKIGMTKEMCFLSWGKPDKINETITENAKSEQCVYSNKYESKGILYFENNILTAIQ